MKKLSHGVVHKITPDIKNTLIKEEKTDFWEGLTPLARNEWICFITSAKKQETQIKRLNRMISDFSKGKKRPCCWPGCSHRKG